MNQQYPLPLPHDVAMGTDDFMVTDSNREALAWCEKWPAWPSHCLILYGPAGCGKTHLAHLWATKSKATTLTLDDIRKGIRDFTSSAAQAIILEGVEAIASDTVLEEALFHLYNILLEHKSYLLLTSSSAPAQWILKLADLRSRLLSVPAIAIQAPDDTLLSALIIKQFRDRQIDVSLDVVEYLLPRITRTPASIRDVVTKLDHTSLAEGRGITVALARRVLEDGHFLISG